MTTVGEVMSWADQIAPMAYARVALRTADQFRKKGVNGYLVKSTKLDKELLDILDQEFLAVFNTALPTKFKQ